MPPEQRPQPAASPPPTAAPGVPDDLQLVAAILRKDRKATARFISEHADAVYGYVRHRLAPRTELVEDVVQDVFLAALASLATFRGTSPLRAWLLGIARHKVESYYRERLREPEPLDESSEPGHAANGPPADDILERQRVHARTRDVLRQLPEPYSLVLLWRYWEGRSAREMAVATGRTEKAIERLLARARARFKQLWERT